MSTLSKCFTIVFVKVVKYIFVKRGNQRRTHVRGDHKSKLRSQISFRNLSPRSAQSLLQYSP